MLNRRPSKAAVGLDQVDNTSDSTKNSAAVTLTNKTLTDPKINAIKDTNGTDLLKLTTVASAANYIEVTNQVTGGNPSINAVGSSADIGISMVMKGGGSLMIAEPAGQTNAYIETDGVETNINIDLLTKGSGAVKANGNPVVSSVTGIPAVTGTPSSSTYLRGDGTWSTISGGGDVTGPASSVDSEIALFSGTGGKTLKRATTTGVAKLTSGVLSAATAGTDYVTPTGSETLTNKTLTSPRLNDILDINGAVIVELNETAGAVNYLALHNRVTGIEPYIAADGADTNINIGLVPKGTGDVRIYKSTGGVSIYANGGDTNVDLDLTTKGAGVVKANNVAVATTTGTQTLTNKTLTSPKIDTIQDANGNIALNLDVYSNAVNYIYVGNAATGAYPFVSAWGTDTDIGLDLKSKGDGPVTMYDGNSNVLFGAYSVSSSAVNYLYATNSATGDAPYLNAGGTDTNIDLGLSPLGTGKVRINGVEVATISDTQTLTNKTIDANGTGNSITNLEIADFAGSAIVTESETISANDNDTTIPTSAAVKGYVDVHGKGEIATESSSASLTLTTASTTYTYTGTSAGTWTLPAVSGNTGFRLTIISKTGSHTWTLTVQRAGSDMIRTTSGTSSSIELGQGGAVILINDGTHWVMATGKPVSNSVFRIQDGADASKSMTFDTSAIATGTGRSIAVQNVAGTMYVSGGTDIPVTDGGTGRSTSTTAYGLIAAGTTATGAHQTLAAGATTEILVGGGASALPVWTTATGSGAPVRATSPTLTNPTLTDYVETRFNIGTVTTTYTFNLSNGTFQTCTLTASTACTFTMPTAVAGKSFIVLVKQAASTGNGTVTFTGVLWSGGTAPTMTAAINKLDSFSFFSDGTSWYGSYIQNF